MRISSIVPIKNDCIIRYVGLMLIVVFPSTGVPQPETNSASAGSSFFFVFFFFVFFFFFSITVCTDTNTSVQDAEIALG